VCQPRFQIVTADSPSALGRGIRGGRPTRVEVNIRVEDLSQLCRNGAAADLHPIRSVQSPA